MKQKLTIKLGLSVMLALVVLTSGVLMGGAFAANSNPYEKPEKYEEVKELYHKRVNDLFNAKLKLLKKGPKGSGTAEIPKGDNCSDNNYSTFCLSLAVATEYDNYVIALEKQKNKVDIPEDEGDDIDLIKLTTSSITKNIEIDNEIVRAKKALDVALATYNEMSATYQQHLEYEILIKNLTKYNKKVIEFREEVEKLPSKFIDATTTQCT